MMADVALPASPSDPPIDIEAYIRRVDGMARVIYDLPDEVTDSVAMPKRLTRAELAAEVAGGHVDGVTAEVVVESWERQGAMHDGVLKRH